MDLLEILKSYKDLGSAALFAASTVYLWRENRRLNQERIDSEKAHLAVVLALNERSRAEIHEAAKTVLEIAERSARMVAGHDAK